MITGFCIRIIKRDYMMVVGHQVVEGEADAYEPRYRHIRQRNVVRAVHFIIHLMLLTVQSMHLSDGSLSRCSLRLLCFSIRLLHFSLKSGLNVKVSINKLDIE